MSEIFICFSFILILYYICFYSNELLLKERVYMKEVFEEYGGVIVIAIVGILLIVGFKEALDFFLAM